VTLYWALTAMGGYRIRFAAPIVSASACLASRVVRTAGEPIGSPAMEVAAIVLYGVSLAITFGVRVAIQLRRTGSTGLHGLPPDAGPLEWIAGGMFIAGLLIGGAAPILALLGILEPIPALDGSVGNSIGLVLALCGIALIFGAQLAMGDSWRVGVDPEERTELVTDGPFKLVRNPIYSAMMPTVFGLVLMVPSVLAIAAFISLIAGLELQVRVVEEPYLLRTHGDEYATYAARVGRFVPGVGLLHGADFAASLPPK
jgi:protein-S-isoprenylcysteine O-methyltransferase Ste14